MGSKRIAECPRQGKSIYQISAMLCYTKTVKYAVLQLFAAVKHVLKSGQNVRVLHLVTDAYMIYQGSQSMNRENFSVRKDGGFYLLW